MYRKQKQLVSLFVLIVLFSTVFSVEKVSADSLSDIPDKYAGEINYLIDETIISGFPDGTFQPKKNVTRAEAAVMIGKAMDLDGEKRESSFDDIAEDFYASGYIESAYEEGILSGVGENRFEPNRAITRGEMAALITRAFKLGDISNVFYLDAIQGDSYYIEINKLSTAGIAVGNPDGTYKPKNPIKREEFAIMVARTINPSFKIDTKQETATKYTTDNLNVRKGPSTSYNRLGLLSKGTKVTVYSTAGKWAYINGNNIKGYVHTDYLTNKQVEKPVEQPKEDNRIIAIDAGHGDHDPGASGNGIIEKEINLDVALRVQDYLEDRGIQVVMTRTDDTFLELDERVQVAVKEGADTFVSIHANKFGDPSANGTETYYSTAALNQRAQDSQKLASFIQNRLVDALGTRDRGVKTANFRVITKTPLPSALVELGFLSNKSDAQILSTHKQASAEAIALGIIDYYNWKEK